MGFQGSSVVKNPPANVGECKRCGFCPWSQEDPLEKGMAHREECTTCRCFCVAQLRMPEGTHCGKKKNYTGAGSGGQNDLIRFISFFSQSPLRLSDWAMEYTVRRHQIYANAH